MTEAVEVTATEGQLLKTDRADVATVFEARQITDLPVIDRNFTKFILLTPGTQQQSWGHAASENPQGSAQTQVNGQTFAGTGYQLDGTRTATRSSASSSSTRTWKRSAKPRSPPELRCRVRAGHCRRGVRTDQVGHERVPRQRLEFLQRDKFRARNPFSEPDVVNPLTGRVLPQTKRDQFGGSIGGRS